MKLLDVNFDTIIVQVVKILRGGIKKTERIQD